MARHRILVLGDAMLDRYWTGAVERISPEAPVPILRVEHQVFKPGGAANVAANLAAMGADVALLAPAALDEAGKQLRDVLELSGVDFVRTTAGRTTVKLRALGPRGHQMLRVDFEGSGEALPQDAEQEICKWFKPAAVVVADYGKGAIGRKTLASSGPRMFVDGGKALDFSAYLRPVEIMKMNLEEFGRQVKRPWPALVVTAAAEPTMAYVGDKLFQVPVEPVEVADVSGAGDTFMAAMVLATLDGAPLPAAIERGHAAARIAVQRRGTAIVSAADLSTSDEAPAQ